MFEITNELLNGKIVLFGGCKRSRERTAILIHVTLLPINPLTACERQREDEVKTRLGLVLGISILIGASTCMAQDAPVPSKPLPRQSETLLQSAGLESAELSALSAMPPTNSISAPIPIVRRFPATRAQDMPRLGAGFYLLTGLNIGMTALDIGLSQHCIAQHRCSEANMLLPSSLAARISFVAAFTALGTYVSHRMKVRGSRFWWIPPFSGTVAHSVGVASGLTQ
ncbi:MAG: hypothetical protein ACP5M4_10355 [Acidobacteriaceae bacterium]